MLKQKVALKRLTPKEEMERDISSVLGKPDAVKQIIEIRDYYLKAYGIPKPY